MAATVNIEGVSKEISDIYLKQNDETKNITIGYENLNGQTKVIYKRKSSKYSELDVELGPGTHVIPNNAIGCAFQARLQAVGGNVQIIAAGMPYNFTLNRGGSSGHGYVPIHSYHMLFPTSDNPEQIRYLEISRDNNSSIRLKKWFVTDNYRSDFIFWRGLKELHVSLAGGSHIIPENVVGCIYKAIPEYPINIDFEFDTKPIYYERIKTGDKGHGHLFGICGMLFFPYKDNMKATRLIINPSNVSSSRLNVISWLIAEE